MLKKKYYIALLIFCVILLILFSFFEPFFVFKEPKVVEIENGESLQSIANKLTINRIILEPYSFIFFARVLSYDSKLKSGIYELQNTPTIYGLLVMLSKGGKPKEISITIPEGFTSKDIAERLYSKHIISDMDKFYNYIKKDEGYLFPDTYNFYEGMPYDEIVKKFKDRFYEVVPKNYGELAKAKGLTEYQALILASIVEKEAKLDEDRPIVASVFLNRLKIDMPLQADSTILYALSTHKEWLSKEDYNIDSPYNTYKYKGLPPTPICNPGIKSIMAVVEAPQTPYYYFMTTPDGKAIFSKTLSEHEANLRKYYGG